MVSIVRIASMVSIVRITSIVSIVRAFSIASMVSIVSKDLTLLVLLADAAYPPTLPTLPVI